MNKYLQLLYDGEYDELVADTLSVLDCDKDAERAFLRLFMQKGPVVMLDFDDTIAPLIKEAEKGNKYAQYAYARWQSLDCGGENSIAISYRNMKAAAEQNLPDAIAGYAMTYEFGDIGIVNWEKYRELVDQSVAMGSELGKMYRLRELCFGIHYQDPQPEKAAELASQYIADDEAAGIEPNGLWFYYRAAANEQRIGRTRVIDDYQRALDLGVLAAYDDLIIAYGYGDDLETLVENKEYNEYLKQGIAHLAAGAFYLDAAREMRRFDFFDNSYHHKGVQQFQIEYGVKQQCHELIFSRLSDAARLGDNAAWEQLGDCYYNGWYDFEKDYKKAFTAYSNGVIHNSVTCAEKMWKMMHDHIIDRPIDYIDSIALYGARWGSKRLLAETVIACQEGRLTEYADEITKYYDPIFDAPEFTLDDEEMDDDGRYDAWE